MMHMALAFVGEISQQSVPSHSAGNIVCITKNWLLYGFQGFMNLFGNKNNDDGIEEVETTYYD